jgi:hypothetical protein
MTIFESRGAHERGEQWNARDTRVYTGLDLHEDKNPTSYVHQLYYDSLGRDPLYLSFYRLRGQGLQRRSGSVIIVPDQDSISTCAIYKIYQ